MISIGSTDEAKRLALRGFGGGSQRAMEDAELEEGEACSYQNGDGDTNIDPDVALSYLDEKLQNVLGHFKKDFEGGISSENLGTKFGGYGSFLTQHSPVWSSSRSPANSKNDHRSSTSSQLEQRDRCSVPQAKDPRSLKHASISTSTTHLHSQRATVSHDPPRQCSQDKVRLTSEEPTDSMEHRTLKVRIKVSSDNLSAKKNAAIYSGLGLDDSPSSSCDGSPMNCQGMPQFGPDESPAQIIHIMTSFPIYGEHLLSPLPDALARLTEKLLLDSNAESAIKQSRAKDVVKLVGKSGFSKDSEKGDQKEKIHGFAGLSKVADIDALAYEELVSNALKLPLLSSSHDTSEELAKESLGGSSCAHEKSKKSMVSDKSGCFSDGLKHELIAPVSSSDDILSKKRSKESSLSRKVADFRKLDLKNSVPGAPPKDIDGKDENAKCSSNHDEKTVGSTTKGSKGLNNEEKYLPKQRFGKNSTSSEQDGVGLHHGSEQLSSKGKKKHKGNQLTDGQTTELSKLSIKNEALDYSASTDAFLYTDRKESDGLLPQKHLSNTRDMYKDFFGDINDERDDLMDSPCTPVDVQLKAPKVTGKSTSQDNTSRERLTSRGATDQSCTRVCPNVSFPTQIGLPTGDTVHIGNVTQDEWVCCDSCEKWRLLPPDFNKTLPDKWLCSMLDCLPGMNSCSFSEEETTRAVRERCQLPAQNLKGFHSSSLGTQPGLPASRELHSDQKKQDTILGGLRKNHVLKDVANSKSASPHPPKSKSLTDPVRSQGNEIHFQQIRGSADAVSDTDQFKKKSRKKSTDSYGDGGLSKKQKIKIEAEPDKDYARASKKSKTGVALSLMNSPQNQGDAMLAKSQNKNIKSDGAGNSHIIHHGTSSRISKFDMDDSLPDTTRKANSQVQASELLSSSDMRKFENNYTDKKKRKANNSQSNHSHADDFGIAHENEQTEPRTARIYKVEEKYSDSSRGSGKVHKKFKISRSGDFQLGIHVDPTAHSLEDNRSIKRDLGSSATSSSSKVSGSHKSKSNLQEVKGSPVESVSSSPFRNVNHGRLSSKNIVEKDDTYGLSFTAKDNSRRHADTEDDSGGNAGCGSIRKSLPETEKHHKFHEPLIHGLPEKAPNGSHVVTGIVPDENVDRHHSRRSAKDHSSRSNDQNQKHVSNKGKYEASEAFNNSQNQAKSLKDKPRDHRVKAPEKSSPFSEGNKTDYEGRKRYPNKVSDGGSRKAGKLKSVAPEDPPTKVDGLWNHEVGSSGRKKGISESEERRNSKRTDLDNKDRIRSVIGKEKSGFNDEGSNRVMPRQENVVGSSKLQSSGPESDKAVKVEVTTKKADGQNGVSSLPLRLSNGHKVKDRDASSPMRRESHSQAATIALKEAKDLKHLADRLKNAGPVGEIIGYYLQASLKFLHGASLLEISSSESGKPGDMVKAIQVYSDTAKLCEFCAHEYERLKDMAAAALAYKCMEVAYLRVIYSSHPSANRDRHKLQASAQMVSQGESPSSSASDIDNTHNPATAEKLVQLRDGSSPQTAGNHVIAARNRPNFLRLLKFMQDVNSAMDASRKAQSAFAAAKADMQKSHSTDGIESIKRAIDFNFHDVEGLLHLVRLATEAIMK